MWKDCSQGIRSSRTAMAGSIYMRRVSVQMRRENEENLKMSAYKRQDSQFGKIKKNNYSRNQNTGTPSISQQINFSFSKSKEFEPIPLSEKKNCAYDRYASSELPKRNFSTLLASMDEPENIKIRTIEQKYRKMLSLYEDKKKAIDMELMGLKSARKNSIQKQNFVRGPSETTQSQKSRSSSFSLNTNIENKKSSQKVEQIPKFCLIKRNNSISRDSDKKTKIQQIIATKIQKPSTGAKIKCKPFEKYPKFFQAMRQQIKLQEELRILKAKVPYEKKQEVRKLINSKYNVEDQDFMNLQDDEIDPFIKEDECQLSADIQADNLIGAHKKCEQNWCNNVCSLTRLDSRNIFSLLNFEKSREISLKALTREIGFILQKHCRNRDLIRIYKRLQPLTENNFSVQLGKADSL